MAAPWPGAGAAAGDCALQTASWAAHTSRGCGNVLGPIALDRAPLSSGEKRRLVWLAVRAAASPLSVCTGGFQEKNPCPPWGETPSEPIVRALPWTVHQSWGMSSPLDKVLWQGPLGNRGLHIHCIKRFLNMRLSGRSIPWKTQRRMRSTGCGWLGRSRNCGAGSGSSGWSSHCSLL